MVEFYVLVEKNVVIEGIMIENTFANTWLEKMRRII